MAKLSPDLLWKGIIESLAEDFLLLFFPVWSSSIDFERGFEFLDNELAQLTSESADQRRVTDKLIKVFLRDGNERWVLIHVEVQGYRDVEFAKRLFIYYYRLYDRYGIPITTLAILTDQHSDFHPTAYETVLAGTRLLFEFNTYKLLEHSLEQLRAIDNPFARALEAGRLAIDKQRLDEQHLFQQTIAIVRSMQEHGYQTEKIRQLMNFLRFSIRFKNKQIMRKFERVVDKIYDNPTAMGLEEIILEETRKAGMLEGKAEGKAEGKLEGKIEGKLESQLQIAHNCWKEGIAAELAATLTDLPLEQVVDLYAGYDSSVDEA